MPAIVLRGIMTPPRPVRGTGHYRAKHPETRAVSRLNA